MAGVEEIDLNNDSDAVLKDKLLAVKGIGPVIASAIISERQQNGPFESWEHLETTFLKQRRVKNWKRGLSSIKKSRKHVAVFTPSAAEIVPKKLEFDAGQTVVEKDLIDEMGDLTLETIHSADSSSSSATACESKEDIQKLEEMTTAAIRESEEETAGESSKLSEKLSESDCGEKLYFELHNLDETLLREDYYFDGEWDIWGLEQDIMIVKEDLKREEGERKEKVKGEDYEEEENNPVGL